MNPQNQSALQQLGRIGLNPVAQPVDQFARPEVRYNDNAGGLLQLAQSLSSINPEIKDTLSKLQQVSERDGRQQAKVDAAALQLKNMDDFKQAVSQGLLKEQHNPWYIVQMEQEVATAEARRATEDMLGEYTTTGLQFEHDPHKIDQWVQGRTVGMLQGRSGAEAEAILGIMEPFRQRMVQGHIESVARLTDRDRQAAIQTTIAGFLKPYTNADLQNPQTLAHVQGQLDAYRQSIMKTMDEDVVDELIGKSLEAESEARTLNVYRPILSGLKRRDGVSLSDFGLNRAKGEEIDHHVGYLALQQERQDVERDKLNQEKADIAAVSVAKARADAQGIPFAQFRFASDEFNKLNPHTQLSFLSLQLSLQNAQQSQKDAADKGLRRSAEDELYTSGLAGLTDPKREKDLLGVLAAHGGKDSIIQWQEFKNFQARNQWAPSTSPDVVAGIIDLYQDGKLTVSHLTSLAKNQQIDEQTFNRSLGWALENGGSWGSGARGPEGLSGYLSMMPNLIAAKAQPNSGYQTLDQVANLPDVALRIASARMSLIDASSKLDADPEYRKLDPAGKRQRLEAVVDSILSNPAINGYTRSQLQAHLEGQAEEQRKAQAAEDATKAAAEAQYAKQHPEDSKFIPPTSFGSPLVPTLSDDQKSTLRRAIGTGASFTASDGRKIAGLDDYHPDLQYPQRSPLVRPLQDLYQRWVRGGYEGANSNALDPRRELPALQKVNENRKSLEAQMERQGARTQFESTLAALNTRDQRSNLTGSWYVLPQEKRTLYEFIDNARTLSLLRSFSTYDLEEVKKMGKGAELTVPMFYTQAELNSPKMQEAASALGYKTLQQQAEFYAAQSSLLIQRRERLLNLR